MDHLEGLLSLSHFRFSYLLFQGLNGINKRVSLSNKMDANQRKRKGIQLTGLLLVAESRNSGAMDNQVTGEAASKGFVCDVKAELTWLLLDGIRMFKFQVQKEKSPTSLCIYKIMQQNLFLRRKCECQRSQPSALSYSGMTPKDF